MRRWAWLAILVLALDRVSKLLASGLTEPMALIPGVIGLRYTENTGMAFSLLSGKAWILGLLSAAVVLALILGLRRFRPAPFRDAAAMLIIGGAIGNMIDRFVPGYVVDMIEVLLFDFPVFNVADIALTVGCVLMGWSLLLRPKDWEKRDGR